MSQDEQFSALILFLFIVPCLSALVISGKKNLRKIQILYYV